MKFTPCANQCSSEGTHCEGCGRTHDEIKATLALVKQITDHMLEMGYDNPEAFTEMLGAKAIKRFNREQSKLK